MSGFSDAWLALREPADHRARSSTVMDRLAPHLVAVDTPVSARRPFRVVDLATGTGSNVRYLVPRLPTWQSWTLLDADVELLRVLPVRMAVWASRNGRAWVQTDGRMMLSNAGQQCSLRCQVADLRHGLGAVEETPGLVTASALLDLVSREWLARLVHWLVEHRVPALFALNYDGRTVLDPPHPDDRFVMELVNRHQHTDKGFGPALGPAASVCFDELCAESGWDVARERSDWVLDRSEIALQAELLSGWATAATELDPASADRVREWERDRIGTSRAGQLHVVVGHDDVAAWPPIR